MAKMTLVKTRTASAALSVHLIILLQKERKIHVPLPISVGFCCAPGKRGCQQRAPKDGYVDPTEVLREAAS